MSALLKITMETSIFGQNSLAMTPDDDGCFNIIVGATNVYNTSGAKYIHNDSVEKIFHNNGEMLSRVKNGLMQSERNHPMPTPNMSSSDYLKRVYTIDSNNVACDILDLRLSKTMVNIGNNNNMIYPVYAKIKPSGPHGDALYKSLTDDDSDTAFSVRSITVDAVVNGVTEKTFKYIVNYDWVYSPGITIAKASMWKSFGLESETSISIDVSMDDINSLSQSITDISGLGLESSMSIVKDLKSMFKACNGDDCIYKQWQ